MGVSNAMLCLYFWMNVMKGDGNTSQDEMFVYAFIVWWKICLSDIVTFKAVDDVCAGVFFLRTSFCFKRESILFKTWVASQEREISVDFWCYEMSMMVGKNESLFLFLCLFKELKDITMKYKWKIEKQIN